MQYCYRMFDVDEFESGNATALMLKEKLARFMHLYRKKHIVGIHLSNVRSSLLRMWTFTSPVGPPLFAVARLAKNLGSQCTP
jgi:hypothetical protein